MRSYALCLAGLMLLGACGSKSDGSSGASGGGEFKASTPKEFWDSYQAVVKRKDAAALAKNLYSKGTAKKQADDIRQNMPNLQGKSETEALTAFFEMLVSEPDEEKFVNVEENGDRATIVFDRKRGGASDRGMKMFLVKEEGRWWQGDGR